MYYQVPSYKAILAVAFPVMFGVLVEFIVAFIDTLFLGRVSELALNTAGNAALIYMTFFMTSQGLSSAMQILIARRYGQQKYQQCGEILGQGVLLLLGFAVFLIISFILLGQKLIPLSVDNQDIALAMDDFLSIRCFGYLFALPQLAMVSFYTGIGKTKVLIGSTLILSGVNILGDYLLIHGAWGFPEMGANGAALASVIAELTSFIFLICYTQFYRIKHASLGIGALVWKKASIYKTINLGAPLMVQSFLSLASWTIFFLFIEKLGSEQLAMSQLVRTLYFLAFIPIMGFTVATKTFISQAIGQGEINAVYSIINKCLILGLAITILTAHGVWLYPEVLVSFIVDQDYLIKGAAEILSVLFPSMLLFSISGVLFSAVSGSGNTRMVLLIEALSILIYLYAAYWLTIKYPQPVHYVWMLEYLYFGFLILASVWYLKSGHWKKLTV